MPAILVSGPAVEPVTLAELKLQIGLPANDDGDRLKSDATSRLLRRYITTARIDCENRTRRAFITQTWKFVRDHWGHPDPEYVHKRLAGYLIPKPPFQSLTSITYIDPSGTQQTLPAQTPTTFGYQLDPGGETQPARLLRPFEAPWPVLRPDTPNAVTLEVVCGFGDDGSTVPVEIKSAILFLAHSYYDASAFKDVDKTVDSLLSPWVNRIA